jgi:hypothetical protein
MLPVHRSRHEGLSWADYSPPYDKACGLAAEIQEFAMNLGGEQSQRVR